MTRRRSAHLRDASSREGIEEQLAELRRRIETGGLDVEMVADSIMFCELGGQLDEFLSSKVEAAMDYLRVVQENQLRPQNGIPLSTPSRSEHSKQDLARSGSGPSQRIDGAAVRDIAVTISGLVGNMAISYWKFRSFTAESEAAEKRLKAAQSEVEATRARKDARQSTAMWTQLGIWSLTTAAKFWTDYSMRSLTKEHALARSQFEAIREIDRESRRSERFDQLLIWGGKAAVETGARYLLQG